jgi:hypothetical protein
MAKKQTTPKAQPKKAQTNSIALQKENAALRAELAALKAVKKSKKREYSFWRAFSAGLLAVLAVLSIGLFNISFWVNGTVINTDKFVTTMQPLIKDPAIQKTLQTEITNQVFSQINLEAELKKALPENLAFIAGPFAGQVKSFTYGKIGDVLNSPQAYNAWTKTLTVSHEKIVAYIQNPNNSGLITVNSVYTLAGDQLKTSDVGFLFGKTLPSYVGSIQLADIKGVDKARQTLYALQKVTLALGIASIVLTTLAVAVSVKRRNMVIGIAVFTLLFMLSTLVALTIGGTQVGSAVDAPFRAASEATYAIITAPLVTQTQGVAAFIGATIIVAIVSSSWRSIVWLRAQLRKTLDWISRQLVGDWASAQWIHWIASNRVVLCWTLVCVSFIAFAVRIPLAVSGIEQALIFSALIAFILEVFASISRTAEHNSVK